MIYLVLVVIVPLQSSRSECFICFILGDDKLGRNNKNLAVRRFSPSLSVVLYRVSMVRSITGAKLLLLHNLVDLKEAVKLKVFVLPLYHIRKSTNQ